MTLKKEGYTKRIVDDKVLEYLKTFGAICIEGPKWCGKTWTALNHSNSVFYVGDPKQNFNNRELAKMNTENVFIDDYPELIDEWQEVPAIWDAVRFKVDENKESGRYILTGSATPINKGILHSGTGRIGRIKMYPMSLYESSDSTGQVSLKSLFEGDFKDQKLKDDIDLDKIIYLIIRGGWPQSVGMEVNQAFNIAKEYLTNVLNSDIEKIDGIKRDKNKMEKLLKSLSRNESTVVSNATLIKDIEANGDDSISKDTLADYLNVLRRLFVINEQEAYSSNVRSTVRIRNTSKKHFVDPSLACAMLNVTNVKLKNDLKTLGFLFESLVTRDLRIYAESLGGNIYHYRDNNDLEIDTIVELPGGEYGAFEIKLGTNEIDNAAKNLLKFSSSMEGQKPSVLCVIVGDCSAAYKREDGVYVIPITSLKN